MPKNKDLRPGTLARMSNEQLSKAGYVRIPGFTKSDGSKVKTHIRKLNSHDKTKAEAIKNKEGYYDMDKMELVMPSEDKLHEWKSPVPEREEYKVVGPEITSGYDTYEDAKKAALKDPKFKKKPGQSLESAVYDYDMDKKIRDTDKKARNLLGTMLFAHLAPPILGVPAEIKGVLDTRKSSKQKRADRLAKAKRASSKRKPKPRK